MGVVISQKPSSGWWARPAARLLILLLVGAVAGALRTLPKDVRSSAANSSAVPDEPSHIVPVGRNFLISQDSGGDAIGGKPAAAFDGANFFVVWRDKRNYDTNGYDIYGARVRRDGTVLDPAGIPISTYPNDDPYPGNQYVPSVGFDGTNFMVVWIANQQAAANFYYQVFAARVTREGVVLDPQGVPITSIPPEHGGDYEPIRMPSIAFDGTNFLVVWRVANNMIRGARLSREAQNLDDPYGFRINSYSSYYPYVAFDGANYLVVWHDSRHWETGWDVYGARVSPAGAVLDPDGFVISDAPHNQEHTSLAFGGKNYLVTWYDWRPNGDQIDGSAYAARVSPDGTVLDDPPIKITDHARGQSQPVVAFDGSDYFVAWMVDNSLAHFRLEDVYGVRVSTDGTILDARPIPVSTSIGHQFSPSIAFGGGRYLVAWNDSQGRCYFGCLYGQLLEKGSSGQSSLAGKREKKSSELETQTGSNPHADGWLIESSPTNYALYDLWGFSGSDVYAVSDAGEIIHNDGSGWSLGYRADVGHQFAIWGHNPNDLWSVGWDWWFYHRQDSTWSKTRCGDGGIPLELWGSSTSDIYVVGSQGKRCHYDGVNWNVQSTGISIDLGGVWGIAANDIYVVGEYATVVHYDGVTWTQLADVPTNQSLNAIWGSSARDVFAVGDFGTILHYDGASWTEHTSNTLEHLFGVWGFNGADVYAVGLNGTVLHFDGAGWQVESSGTQENLHDVWGVLDTQRSLRRVWAVGGHWAPEGRVVILNKTSPAHASFLPLVVRGHAR